MNAKEARELSESHISEEFNIQMNEIKEVISSEAKNGKTSTYYYDVVRGDVKAKLIEEGYQVKDSHDRDGYICTISW